MNIFRRIISIFSIAIILVVVVYGLFWLKTRSSFNQEPELVIPSDFSILLRVNDFREFQYIVRKESPVLKEIYASELIEKSSQFERLLNELDSLGMKNSSINELFTGKVLFSLHESEDNYHLLFARKSRNQNVTEEWLKILGSGSNISKKKFENVSYYLIEFPEEELFNKLSFFENNGIIAVSTSEELLKRAVRSMNADEHILRSHEFARVSSTAGSDAVANLFLNYKELNHLLQSFFEKENFPDLFSEFTTSVLDLEMNSESVVINGFTSFYGKTNPGYLEYKEAEKGFSLLQHIPFDPVMFDLQKGRELIEFNTDKENIALNGILKTLSKQFKEETCYYMTNKNGKLSSGILVDLESGFTTDEFLKEILGEQEENNSELQVRDFSIDNIKYTFYHQAINPLTKFFKINPDKEKDYPYYAVYNNILIFAESEEFIREFIYSNMLGTTLNNSEDFKSLSGNFSSSSNRFCFLNTSQYLEVLLKMLKPDIATKLESGKKSLKKFDAVSFQSTRSDDLHYFRIFINYSGELKQNVKTVWKRKLDTISNFKPTIVTNHNNGDKEIMLQDINNNLYLISSSGNILWKQKLNGTILGEILQVDYYNNGKYQYLFNTGEMLYLIDRNGNPVEKFPVTFREKAVTGISVLDYDNNGDWRIPVSCADRKIYMYNKEAKLVNGWNFKSGDYPVSNTIQHKKIKDKDYIIAKEEFQIYFLDRKGGKRIKPDQQIQFSNNPLIYDRGNGNPYMLATDKEGSVYRFYFNEKVEKIMDNNYSPEHYFLAEDITGDLKKEFIFIDGDALFVFDDKKKIVFKKDLPESIKLPPVIYEFSSRDKKIGVVATKTGEIYLYNVDGSQYKGFPLIGSSLYSISAFPGLKDRFNLIVNNKDNFLYNYFVQ